MLLGPQNKFSQSSFCSLVSLYIYSKAMLKGRPLKPHIQSFQRPDISFVIFSFFLIHSPEYIQVFINTRSHHLLVKNLGDRFKLGKETQSLHDFPSGDDTAAVTRDHHNIPRKKSSLLLADPDVSKLMNSPHRPAVILNLKVSPYSLHNKQYKDN